MQLSASASNASIVTEAIPLFGIEHLVGLSLIVLLIAVFIIFKKVFTSGVRKWAGYTMGGLLLINEVWFHAIKIAVDQWSIQTALPLQLCSILVYLSAWTLIARDRRVFEPLYYLGLIGASQALITPQAPGHAYAGIHFFQTMISHGLIILTIGFLAIVEQWRLPKRFPFYILYLGAAYMILVGFFNACFDSNYLLMNQKPEFPTILDYLPEWPGYVPCMYLIAGVLVFVIYAFTPRKY